MADGPRPRPSPSLHEQTIRSTDDGSHSLTPRRLELSLSPEDGSLLTAPLSTVVLAATDGLYSDLYSMVHGELLVANTVAQTQTAAADDGPDGAPGHPATLKQDRMSNLSFAERRHELAWRLAQHGKSIAHVAALTAACATGELSHATQVSTRALQHARTAWVQADEAQDALYFFHAQLFPARQAPHDVYAALDMVNGARAGAGSWRDLPTDLKLVTDRYEASQEHQWPATEVKERWHMAVREKLLTGELGWMRQQQIQQQQQQILQTSPLYKLSLKGGIVKLTHGQPKRITGATTTTSSDLFPIEAQLTVLSTAPRAEWTLLSVQVTVQTKTGEYNHQLNTTNRQRFNLHRLCALAMNKEEARARTRREREKHDEEKEEEEVANVQHAATKTTQDSYNSEETMARPLDCLFQVAHTFALSWQLEILSAQAQALKRAGWAGGDSAVSTLLVTPVNFTTKDNTTTTNTSRDRKNALQQIGMVSVSFWDVDDRYGPPSTMDLDLLHEEQESLLLPVDNEINIKTTSRQENTVPSKLTLSVRAMRNVGIRVSLSGGGAVMESLKSPQQQHVRATVEQLLQATSNPFTLSMSDALLAATTLCGELKCHAMAKALQSQTGERSLPPWMRVSAQRGSIDVAAQVTYGSATSTGFVRLFRLGCDARTGGFVSLFSRSTTMLRLLACNDAKASESMTLRIAKTAQHRQKTAAASSTGRIVRDAFESLIRSANQLGRRVGVGGTWDDLDDQSVKLRQRAIQLACADTRASLMTCCGMATVYGLSALALGVATGVSAAADMAGDAVHVESEKLLAAPPVSALLDHQLVQRTELVDGREKKTIPVLERELFAVTCAVSDPSLTLHAFDVVVQQESPSSVPRRQACERVAFVANKGSTCSLNDIGERPTKRPRVVESGDSSSQASDAIATPLLQEAEALAEILSATIDS